MLSGLPSFVLQVLFFIPLGLELTPMTFTGCFGVFVSFSSIRFSFHFVLGLELTPMPFAGCFSAFFLWIFFNGVFLPFSFGTGTHTHAFRRLLQCVFYLNFLQYGFPSILFWDWNTHPYAFRGLLQCVPFMLFSAWSSVSLLLIDCFRYGLRSRTHRGTPLPAPC